MTLVTIFHWPTVTSKSNWTSLQVGLDSLSYFLQVIFLEEQTKRNHPIFGRSLLILSYLLMKNIAINKLDGSLFLEFLIA